MDAGGRYLLPMLPVLLVCVWLPLRQHLRSNALAFFLIAHGLVATGYWVAIDLPRARDCNALWSSVEQLAARVPPDGSNGVSAAVPECVSLMLEFTLDRPVEPLRQLAAVRGNVRWIVAPSGEDVPPGFVTRTTSGAYRLSVREP